MMKSHGDHAVRHSSRAHQDFQAPGVRTRYFGFQGRAQRCSSRATSVMGGCSLVSKVILLLCAALPHVSCSRVMPSPLWPAGDIATSEQALALAQERVDIAPAREWAAPPLQVERAFDSDLEILGSRPIKHGQTKTRRLTARWPEERVEFDFKWKPARADLRGVNNAPRKELAAYQIQSLVLDPGDFVVPTTKLLCLEPGVVADGLVDAPNVEGVDCVVGAASLWLERVRYPDKKIDADRFLDDPVYAYHAANLNVVGILMDHSDTHARNLLVSEDPSQRRIYAVDNGITFNSWFRSAFSRDWNRLRVPALRAETIKRLREVTREDLEFLGTLAELRRDAEGHFRIVSPGTNLNRGRAIRRRDGIIQIGLSEREIDRVWQRRSKLLRAVDSGKIPLF